MYWMQSTTTQKEKPTHVTPKKGLIHRKGLLLIDDDEFFRALFQAIADSLGLPAETYASLSEMPSVGALKDYDVVILDYYLESFRGPEIAEYVDVFFKDLPVLVISGGEITDHDQRAWPACIRRFVPKSSGPYTIIERALEALESRPATAKASNLN